MEVKRDYNKVKTTRTGRPDQTFTLTRACTVLKQIFYFWTDDRSSRMNCEARRALHSAQIQPDSAKLNGCSPNIFLRQRNKIFFSAQMSQMSLTSTQQGSFSVTQDKTEGIDPQTKSSKYVQERCNATDVIFPHTLFFHAPHLSTHFLSEK